MFNRDTWKEIFNSIGKNKLRTFLTGFSVAWAIFILVFLLASVNGMQNGFLKQFSDDATNSIFIYPATTTKPYGGYEAGRRIELDNDDMTFIKRNFEGYYEYISPRVFQSVSARFGPETGSYQMQGVSPDHMYSDKHCDRVLWERGKRFCRRVRGPSGGRRKQQQQQQWQWSHQ